LAQKLAAKSIFDVRDFEPFGLIMRQADISRIGPLLRDM